MYSLFEYYNYFKLYDIILAYKIKLSNKSKFHSKTIKSRYEPYIQMIYNKFVFILLLYKNMHNVTLHMM